MFLVMVHSCFSPTKGTYNTRPACLSAPCDPKCVRLSWTCTPGYVKRKKTFILLNLGTAPSSAIMSFGIGVGDILAFSNLAMQSRHCRCFRLDVACSRLHRYTRDSQGHQTNTGE
jgi:hypothetical protein